MPNFMLPEIRAAYKQALAELRAAGKEAKPLYHWSKDTEGLMAGPKIGLGEYPKTHEPWKPPALYAADNLDDLGELIVGEPGRWATRQLLGRTGVLPTLEQPRSGFTRVVPKPNATIHEIPEYLLEEGASYPDTDILKIKDADSLKGVSEYLIRNPKAVRIFSKDKAWLPMLAGAVGASVLGTPDSAEAITPLQFWKAVKSAGYGNLHRSRQAAIARSIRNLPKPTLDKIESVESSNSLNYNTRGTSTSWRDPNSTFDWNDARHQAILTPIEKSVIKLAPNEVFATTPTHEGLHTTWYDALPEDKEPFINFWQDLGTTGKLGRVENIFESGLDNPSELFAEYGAHRLQKTPAYEQFRQKWSPIADEFDRVLKKYVRGGKLPAALLTSMGLGALADPEQAEAGPRSNALRAALKGTLYHGSPDIRPVVEEGPKLASRLQNQAMFVTDRPSYASAYTDMWDKEPAEGAGVAMFHLDPKARVKVARRGNTYYFNKEEAKALKDQGYDAITTMPSKTEISYSDSLRTGLGSSELAVLNPEVLQPGARKAAIATALGLGSLYGASDSEAMPIGKLKPLTKPLTGMVRSEDAFYRLLGHKLRGNQEVVDVMKNPKNDWRYIISKDAEGKRSVLPMTKDYVHVYSGAKGTQDYLKRFNQEGHQGKKLQALKSLTIRETAREATSAVPEKDFRAWNKMQMEKAKEIDPDLVNDYAYVKILDDRGSGPRGQSLYMPRPYAEFLARKGYVKILKR